MIKPHARSRLQSPAQFKTLSVVPAEPHRKNAAYAESRQIIQDGAGTPGLRANVYDVEDRQACFNGSFLFVRVDLEVTIQTEVAQHGDAQAGVGLGQLMKAG